MESVGQISLFDLIPFACCQKSQEQNDIDFIVRRGSSFEKGKVRILAYYHLNNPSMSQFADFLKKEYGLGGWSIGYASEDHFEKGIKFQKDGRKYNFSWVEFAKHVAKSIEDGEYVTDSDIPKAEYFKIPNPPKEIYPFNYLRKTYEFSFTYGGRKIITAYLSSVVEEQTKDCIIFKPYYCVNDYTDIGIHELIVGIESGAYDNVKEIWRDIAKSLRRISPTVFGGGAQKWLDERGVQEFFDNYKKTGSCLGTKPTEDYPHHQERNNFYSTRLRVKRGELSEEYL